VNPLPSQVPTSHPPTVIVSEGMPHPSVRQGPTLTPTSSTYCADVGRALGDANPGDSMLTHDPGDGYGPSGIGPATLFGIGYFEQLAAWRNCGP
jgi:hypothetical protein